MSAHAQNAWAIAEPQPPNAPETAEVRRLNAPATAWAAQGGLPGAGIPPGLTLTSNGRTPSAAEQTCGWTITGEARLPEAVYNIVFAVTDDDGATDNVQVSLDVRAEGTTIEFDSDNPAAWEVEAPRGDSGPFSLFALVEEMLPESTLGASTAAPGDIGEAAMQITLVPVGPGGTYTVTCTPVNDPVAFEYDGLLEVRCDFDNVAVNTYTIEALLIDGGSGLFYSGFEDDTLTVFDPSLGFATGGGNFIWPESDERTNFGFSVEGGSRKKTKGSLLVMRKLADGTKFRIKSNAMTALAIGQETDFGWAAFEGKCTYQDPSMPEPIGNHEFIAYVEDHGTPGRAYDRFWIQVFGKDGRVIAEMSFYRDAETHAAIIGGGNVIVPH